MARIRPLSRQSLISEGRAGLIVHVRDRRSREDVARVLVILVLVYETMGFLGPIVIYGLDAWAIAAFWSGTVCGQAGFLAVWAGLGPFRLRVRWPLVLLTVFGLYFSICPGIMALDESIEFASMASSSLFIPLLSLFALLPLWIGKTLGGWQIVLASEAHRHSAATARQFGLLHILTLTAVVGVALSLARFAMESTLPPGGRSDQMTADMWMGLGIMCLVVCLYSTVWTLLSTWACFLAPDGAAGFLVMGGVWIGASVLVTVIMGVMSAISGGGSSGLPPEAVGSVFLHYAGLAAVLGPSLALLRAGGCGMIRMARQDQRVAEAQGASPFAPADQPMSPADPPASRPEA